MPQESSRSVVGQRPLVSLSDYSFPSMPTEHAIRRYWRLLRLHFHLDSADPVRAGARLQPAARKLLDAIAAPPACGPLMEELECMVQGWLAQAPKDINWMRTVITAPCDHGDLVGTWAEQQGHQVLRPPPRAALYKSVPQIDWQALPGDGLLVVPQLERWFLRERDGLATVRGLLEALSQLQRPCIVSCNSWAWAYLEKAAGASLVLPSAVTFKAFRAKQLNAWFSSLAHRDAQAAATLWHGALGPHEAPSANASDGNASEGNASEDNASDSATASGASRSSTQPAQAPALTAASTGAATPEKRKADARTSAAVEVHSDAVRGQPLVFRLSSTGADVLRDPSGHDEDDGANAQASDRHQDAYLQRLAARSLGIPWVAWNLWRDGLRAAQDSEQIPDKVKDTVQDDGHTLWVSELPEFSLPSGHERAALMVAHALLLHGGLTRAQLQDVLPAQEAPGVLAALHSAGYVEWCDASAQRADGASAAQPSDLDRQLPRDPQRGLNTGNEAEVRVRACAYPALRSALKIAGFPTGVI